MAVGFELARLLMEQSVSEQAGQMPEEDLDCGDETAQPAGVAVAVASSPCVFRMRSEHVSPLGGRKDRDRERGHFA